MKNNSFKKFTARDVSGLKTDYQRIYLKREELIESLLPWQKSGLSYTASGYGKKIPSTYKIHFEGQLYRVYATIFSNAGTCWIQTKKYGRIIID